MFQWNDTRSSNIRSDVMDLIRIFYDSLGGQKTCKTTKGSKRYLLWPKTFYCIKKFKSAGHLRQYIENIHLT